MIALISYHKEGKVSRRIWLTILPYAKLTDLYAWRRTKIPIAKNFSSQNIAPESASSVSFDQKHRNICVFFRVPSFSGDRMGLDREAPLVVVSWHTARRGKKGGRKNEDLENGGVPAALMCDHLRMCGDGQKHRGVGGRKAADKRK
jgi:hypothetical protein